MRVIVVDDSAFMRRILKDLLDAEEDIEVINCAEGPNAARAAIRELDPDVVTLDVEMPGMNGIDFLEKIMKLRPTPVVMVSSLTTRGADCSLAALELGAIEVVEKPLGSSGRGTFGARLAQAVRTAANSPLARSKTRSGTSSPPIAANSPTTQKASAPTFSTANLILLGASTGGVSALSSVLQSFAKSSPPVVIAQHMPDTFIDRLADRLNETMSLDVSVARDGEVLGPGRVRFAPATSHVRLGGSSLTTKLSLDTQTGPVSGHIPSVDVLFQSGAELTGGGIVAALLTGMGRDGAIGMLKLREANAFCIAQDEATSVVFGMPGAAIKVGAPHAVLPIGDIGAQIAKFFPKQEGTPPC
ncbi:MAG: chemotaxis response regulator protein-glutamate methylesterase [Pseudomonadota bacterium]